MKLYVQILVFCVLPLLAGAIVYFFFRAHGIMGFAFGEHPILPKAKFLVVLLGVLPDLCWAYSLANALYLYFRHTGRPFASGSLLILPLVLASELVQLWLPRYFTFDLLDLAASLIAFLLSALYFKNHWA
jgi:hypothetical protein